MAQPDPASLDPARYPFHCAIATRYGDIDANRHVNNVALLGIMEDTRVRFHAASGYHSAIAGLTTMVASFAVEYLGQAFYPQPLDGYVAVARLGRTSYGLQQLLKQENRIVSFAQLVMVCMADDRPAPVPAAFVEGAAAWMLRP